MHTAGPAADHIAKHLMSGRCDALPDLRGAEAGMMKRRAEGVLFQPKSTPSFTEKHREFSTRVNKTRAGILRVIPSGFCCFRPGMTKRCKQGQIGRFQFRLPVEIPQPDRVTKTQCGVRPMSIGRCGPGELRLRCWPRGHAPLPGD